MDEESFKGMRNLQILKVHGILHLPQSELHLPRKLRLLEWNEYPSKCLPSNFKAECLIELIMERSNLEKLWEGTLVLIFNFMSTVFFFLEQNCVVFCFILS